MKAAFHIGRSEIHHIVVAYANWSSLLQVFVDGAEIHRERNWFSFRKTIDLEIGTEEKHVVSLRFNVLTLQNQAYVDDELAVGCLFPQVVGGLALLASFLALFVQLLMVQIMSGGFGIIGIGLLALLAALMIWALFIIA